MRISLLLAALSAAVNVKADDYLQSERLAKRSLDNQGHFNLSFFHVNDVHAHLDEFSSAGSDCTDPSKGCYGGYARIKTKVDQLRDEHPDHLWLDAGDEFQGTLFYTFYGGSKIAETINELQFDAMTLGNHEWDGGDDRLGDFLLNLTFPIISCNVKSENDKLNKTIKNYHIFEKQGVAVIGATTADTPSISNVGNETTFLDPIPEMQKAVWEIRNTTNITRIVALTHIGYDIDQKLAAQTEGLSLIIGGHSHTLLGDMKDAEGKYPTIVKDLTGHEVFIVTAYRWGEYLGSIDVTFDEDGKALAYHGAPIHMTNTTEQDPELQGQIEEWRKPFEEFAGQVIGSTDVDLDQARCKKSDCLLGEVMADAMLEYRRKATGSPNKPSFAFLNGGGVRAAISKGNITRGDVLTAFPFSNAVVELTYPGSDLRKILEGAVSRTSQFNNKPLSSTIQVSGGILVEYDPSSCDDPGSMLVNVTIEGEELDNDKRYKVVTVDYVAGGGDNILPASKDFATLDTLDVVLEGYVQEQSPMSPEFEQRIRAIGKQRTEEVDESTSNADSDLNDDDEGRDSAAAGIPLSLWTHLLFAYAVGVWSI